VCAVPLRQRNETITTRLQRVAVVLKIMRSGYD
jgi:hypothetical protein